MIIFFSITRDYLNVFLISAQKIHIERLEHLGEAVLNQFVQKEWLSPYENYRKKGSITEWKQAICRFSQRMGTQIWSRLAPHVDLKQIDGLIFIPAGILYLLPFHLIALNSVNNEATHYLIDEFQIAYAPNFRLFKLCHEKPDIPIGDSKFLGICNPDQSLAWADLEMEFIASLFKEAQVLRYETANRIAIFKFINDYSLVHFATHAEGATFDEVNVGLLLADGSLGMRDIFNQIKFPQSYMTVLSACETGMIKPDQGDEYIGLPASFLYAAMPSIVSSLWLVADESSALLMIEFYQNLVLKKQTKAEALNSAIKWLRQVTNGELIHYLKTLIRKLENDLKNAKQHHPAPDEEIQRKTQLINLCFDFIEALVQEKKNLCAFANPFYWGAFVITGKMI